VPGTKHCPTCGADKDAVDFPKNKSRSDGLGGYCTICYNKMRSSWRSEHRNSAVKTSAEYRKENPEKCKAHNKVCNAVRDNRLERSPCMVCGDREAQGHHEDYSKPLDVIWLCRKHHAELHRKEKCGNIT
jgi:hypothetical protein